MPDDVKTPEDIQTPKDWSPVLDNDLDDVVKEMPTPIPDAISAAQVKDRETAAQVRDPKGRVFDPAIHLSDASGNPILTPTGRFKLKMRIPKPGSGLNMPIETPQSSEYAQVARTLVGLFVQTGYAVFGEDWLPEKSKEIDEETNLIKATEDYCASTGFKDLPPGVVISVAFIGYGLRRLNKPRVKSVIGSAIQWARTAATNIWLKLSGQKIRVVPADQAK